MEEYHKEKIARARRGTRQSKETKRKISNSMKGTSNFEGQKHTTYSKDRIRHKRGHADRIQGRMWAVNSSGKTTRVYVPPKGYKRHKRKYTLNNATSYERTLSFKEFLNELLTYE